MQEAQRIRPCLWFDHQAEEAVTFYASIFPSAKIGTVMRYGEARPLPKGTVLSIEFELEGQQFIALNGGPHYRLSPAISLFVTCRTQTEVDELWSRLSEGGETLRCGWLTDRYGVTWQIVPAVLGEMLREPDPARSTRVMTAMLAMEKLDIAALERAYAS